MLAASKAGCTFDYWEHVAHDERLGTRVRAAYEAAPPAAQQAFDALSDCFDAGVVGKFLSNCLQLPGALSTQTACSDAEFAVYGTCAARALTPTNRRCVR